MMAWNHQLPCVVGIVTEESSCLLFNTLDCFSWAWLSEEKANNCFFPTIFVFPKRCESVFPSNKVDSMIGFFQWEQHGLPSGPEVPVGCFDSWSCNLDETGSAGSCHHLYPNTSICIASDLATSTYVPIYHPRHRYQLGQQKHVPPGAPLDFWCWIHEASMSRFVMTALKRITLS